MKIAVILGTTRQGRITERITNWVAESARQHEELGDITVLDLKDFDLPFMNEAISPKYNPNRAPEGEVKRWLDALNEADGYIIVSPEYNRSMPGVLKNAIDQIAWEIDRKPVALVTHGGSGGYGASENIRAAIRQLGAVNVPDAVALTGATAVLDDAGVLTAEEAERPYGAKAQLSAVLDGLAWYAKTLKAGRDQA